MAEEKPLGILEMTKSGMTYSLALSMLGAQAAYRLAAREGEPLPGEPISEKGLSPEDRLQDLFKAAFEAGDHVQKEFWDSVAHYVSPNSLTSANSAMQLGSEFLWDVAESFRFFWPDSKTVSAWREIFNKVDVYQLVRSVQSKLKLPREGEFNLADYVEKAYDLGPYAALWAVEGLGHDYADSVREKGEDAKNLLRGKRIEGIPAKSLLMLHAGIGLSFAQHLLSDKNSQTPEDELRSAVDEFVRLCRENSEPGYTGAALESLGLVTRTFHSELMPVIDRLLEEAHPEVTGYFWHGAGRAVYFLLVNFLPYRDPVWRAVEIGRKEATSEKARQNLMAGTAWALTLVNMRQPQIMASFLEDHADDLWQYRDAFANGVASSVIMRYDTSPDDSYLESFRNFDPANSNRRAGELWKRFIQDPVSKALDEQYTVLRDNHRLDEVFECRNLQELVDSLNAKGEDA